MKRSLILSLIVCLLAGCQTARPDIAQDDIRLMMEALLHQKPGALADYGSEALGKATTFEAAESQIYQVIDSFTIESIGPTRQEDSLAITEVSAAPSDFILRVALDESNRIEGVFIKTDPKPESGEHFYEDTIQLGEHAIPGFITYPKDVTDPPVVILLTGSGPQDRNQMIGPNVPFKDLAHGLAKAGIATIRYDDRYYHDPALYQQKTIDEEMLDDAAAAMELAKELAVDPNRIYLLGHSLGGMMVPKLLKENPGLAGGIILAGSPRPLYELIRDQQLALFQSQSAGEKQVANFNAQMDQVGLLIEAMEAPKGNDILGLPDSYWLSLRQAAAPNHSDFAQPALILQGGRDFQVFAETDYPAWQELFRDRSDISYQLFESLNHLFMPSLTGDITEYYTAQTLDPAVIEAISQWIERN